MHIETNSMKLFFYFLLNLVIYSEIFFESKQSIFFLMITKKSIINILILLQTSNFSTQKLHKTANVAFPKAFLKISREGQSSPTQTGNHNSITHHTRGQLFRGRSVGRYSELWPLWFEKNFSNSLKHSSLDAVT